MEDEDSDVEVKKHPQYFYRERNMLEIHNKLDDCNRRIESQLVCLDDILAHDVVYEKNVNVAWCKKLTGFIREEMAVKYRLMQIDERNREIEAHLINIQTSWKRVNVLRGQVAKRMQKLYEFWDEIRERK